MPDRGVAHGRAHDDRLTAAEDRLIFFLQLRVSRKRVALQTIADELHRPGGSWRRRRARGRRRGFCRELRRPDAWRVAGNADLPGPRVRPLPLLGGVTGHAANVSERLRWQRAFSTEPVLHALGTGVVGGGREPEIAEFGAQLAPKLRPLLQPLAPLRPPAPFSPRGRPGPGAARIRPGSAPGARPTPPCPGPRPRPPRPGPA